MDFAHVSPNLCCEWQRSRVRGERSQELRFAFVLRRVRALMRCRGRGRCAVRPAREWGGSLEEGRGGARRAERAGREEQLPAKGAVGVRARPCGGRRVVRTV